jgi:hypothetical protein
MNGVPRDIGLHGDVLHRGSSVAALEEELGRCVEDARTSAGGLLLAHSGGVFALVLDLDHEFILQYLY